MNERVDIGDATLYCGDCREIVFPRIKAQSAAIVTDPPYGISYRHGARFRNRLMGTDGMAIVGDDRPFDPSPWLRYECLFWGAEHFKNKLPNGGRWLVWNKRRPGVVRDQGCVENAWHSQYGVTRIYHHVWDGADLGIERGSHRVHSNQKPIGVMTWCLSFTEAKTVIDPYMGSGTTGIACAQSGRKFIGIEIDPKHFDIACTRIENAQRQAKLFPSEAPLKHEQLEIAA